MKNKVFIFALIMLILISLTGCDRDNTLQGLWQDSDGYMISFSGQYMVESIYGKELSCSEKDGKITYQWPDGFIRTTGFSFTKDGKLIINIAGKDREFQRASQRNIVREWNEEFVDRSVGVKNKYVLMGNTNYTSELYLLKDNSYALTYIEGSIPVETYYNSKPDEVIIGMYADRGESGSIVLYQIDAKKCELFRKSNSDLYIGTNVLEGVTDSLLDDYSSPVNLIGYCISGTFKDNYTGTVYVFSEDNNLVKILPDGSTLNYVYFIDREGLVKLGCVDVRTDADYMWIDVKTGNIYSLVYQKDGWTEYLASITSDDNKSVINNSSVLIDYYSINESYKNEIYLLCEQEVFLNDLYYKSSQGRLKNSIKAKSQMIEYQKQLKDKQETKIKLEEEKREEKERFLSEMSVLAEQRKLEELEAFNQYEKYMNGQGYVYNKDLDVWQVPGRSDNYIESPKSYLEQLPKVLEESGLSVPDELTKEFDDTPENYISSYPLKSNIMFVCNCEKCHKENMPVEYGESNVALVDTSVWNSDMVLVIGESLPIQVTTRSGKTLVTGNNIIVYLVDHNLVSSLTDGSYKVVRN